MGRESRIFSENLEYSSNNGKIIYKILKCQGEYSTILSGIFFALFIDNKIL